MSTTDNTWSNTTTTVSTSVANNVSSMIDSSVSNNPLSGPLPDNLLLAILQTEANVATLDFQLIAIISSRITQLVVNEAPVLPQIPITLAQKLYDTFKPSFDTIVAIGPQMAVSAAKIVTFPARLVFNIDLKLVKDVPVAISSLAKVPSGIVSLEITYLENLSKIVQFTFDTLVSDIEKDVTIVINGLERIAIDLVELQIARFVVMATLLQDIFDVLLVDIEKDIELAASTLASIAVIIEQSLEQLLITIARDLEQNFIRIVKDIETDVIKVVSIVANFDITVATEVGSTLLDIGKYGAGKFEDIAKEIANDTADLFAPIIQELSNILTEVEKGAVILAEMPVHAVGIVENSFGNVIKDIGSVANAVEKGAESLINDAEAFAAQTLSAVENLPSQLTSQVLSQMRYLSSIIPPWFVVLGSILFVIPQALSVISLLAPLIEYVVDSAKPQIEAALQGTFLAGAIGSTTLIVKAITILLDLFVIVIITLLNIPFFIG